MTCRWLRNAEMLTLTPLMILLLFLLGCGGAAATAVPAELATSPPAAATTDPAGPETTTSPVVPIAGFATPTPALNDSS